METGGGGAQLTTSEGNQEMPRGTTAISVGHTRSACHRTSVPSPAGRKGMVSVRRSRTLDEEELASRTATVEHQWACEEVASGHLLLVLLQPVVSGSGTLQRNARFRWRPSPGAI